LLRRAGPGGAANMLGTAQEPSIMPGAFFIGDWRVDPSLHSISGASGEVRLEPKVMQVLVELAEHPGQVVSKDRLLQTVWADTFVGDEVLARAISELRRVLGDDPKAPRFIQTIPKGGYRLIAPVRFDGATNFEPPAVPIGPGVRPGNARRSPQFAARPGRRKHTLATVAALLIAAGAGGLSWWTDLWRRSHTAAATTNVAPMRVVPLTTLPGRESSPTFSPDGSQVAFEWNGEKEKYDLYVTLVGSSESRRLTTDPDDDIAPSWSPDGLHIAFLRRHTRESGGGRIYLISPLGGPEWKVSDFLAMGPVAWTPDGRHLAVTHSQPGQPDLRSTWIYLVGFRGEGPRPLTRRQAPASEHSPAFSPDGRHLAYASCAPDCDVYVVDLNADFSPAAGPRRLTSQRSFGISGLAWTRDGNSIICDASLDGVLYYLWRVTVAGNAPPQRIEVAGLGAGQPATALSRDRLAFMRDSTDIDIYRFEPGRGSQPVSASSFPDLTPQFSPDGNQIVLSTARSGVATEVWISDIDGSRAHQLTHGPGPWQGSAHWSPDSRQIAFDSQAAEDGHSHVWTIDADGGAPRQITRDAGDHEAPTWSRDGRWIYFSSASSLGGPRDIWRVPANGGGYERVTRGGSGYMALESSDGKELLYQPSLDRGPLMAMPVAGGPARQLVSCVTATAFGVGPGGIYYVGCEAGADPPLYVLNTTTGRTELLGKLEKRARNPSMGLPVSPDGNIVLYQKLEHEGSDLMLIENFR
jgi:Tol biopolymer transport system component/DNA-binding winged helix-turn-helix (wHTH) protein